ncbi:hypothetical protein [Vibrio alginolyticus]
MRFKTEITEARKKAVDSALAVVRKRAQRGETSAAVVLEHSDNARYKLVDWLRSYFIHEGFDFEHASTAERITVRIKW